MPSIRLETPINAPIELCFNLSRNIDIHLASTKQTQETAIAGKTSGLIELGETVTWRARHFGVWQTLTSKVTEMEEPFFFADEMVHGAFKYFRHEHHFIEYNGCTLMTDVFIFESPLKILGKLANALFLTRYMTTLLATRNSIIKHLAEQQ
ncbi:ligand-binding SRPBCC domain-containing protein [Mucilaginibacter gracilis]|uniref:Ligand-binding SRPBCC domain-containing protein n=1 Tax=Mucilaginibacter gracilis TaxID=423350 RepID=A0A495J5Q0_9SPHI|nr:SRPBCC family protein [Mucilaginibacter gracilis]RKR83952.1 ligand-binding SRPBCC domain-containing protein [Mucilaginibacter gracilis]